MRVGVPTEIKPHEYRVGLVPAAVRELVHHGHHVVVQSGAGLGIGCDDSVYRAAGAEIAADAAQVFAQAAMVVKVKEPQPSEYGLLRPGQVLFTYLHLAPDPVQTRALMQSGCTAIAYETVTDGQGGLPLLAPRSEVAGRMAVQVGARCLEKEQGGAGILLGGVPGVAPGHVVVVGGGVVGTSAARMAMGLGARVSILDKSLPRLRHLDELFGGRLTTRYATFDAIETLVPRADVLVGAVLVPGAATPRLVSADVVAAMRPGSVIVDVAIDQGGCVATARPTSHAQPTYVEHGVVHYCVTNMPGAVARTSAFALGNATLPFVLALADKVIAAVKSGAIKRFVVMAGCDGRHKSRGYYTEVAGSLPQDTVILTAGCAKYRYNKLALGDIGGIPRVLDAGQCNDSYSLAVIALKLKEAFGLKDINELPVSYDIAWYEQKAVAVLLALLFLGVKGIRLGPTLPAFLSPAVVKVLVEKFAIKPIGTVQDDITAMMKGE